MNITLLLPFLLRDRCTMVCIDHKYRLKVGEPGIPVAAAERGQRVIVHAGKWVTMTSQYLALFPQSL